MKSFKRFISEDDDPHASVKKKLADEITKPHPKLVVKDQHGHTHLLTNVPGASRFRITKFDANMRPTGHKEYERSDFGKEQAAKHLYGVGLRESEIRKLFESLNEIDDKAVMNTPSHGRIKAALEKVKKKYADSGFPEDKALRYLSHGGKTHVMPADAGIHHSLAKHVGADYEKSKRGYIYPRDVRPITKLGISRWAELRHNQAATRPKGKLAKHARSSGNYINWETFKETIDSDLPPRTKAPMSDASKAKMQKFLDSIPSDPAGRKLYLNRAKTSANKLRKDRNYRPIDTR